MDENFEIIYEDVYNASVNRLNEVKRKNRMIILTVLIILLIINIIIYVVIEYKAESLVAIAISIIVVFIYYITGKQGYRRVFKQTVIENLVKNYNPKLYYSIDGITRMDYKISEFDSRFDDFQSEDRIYGRLKTGDNVQIAEIITYDIRITNDLNGRGREERVKTFSGMYGIVRLEKNLLSNIQISLNSIMKRNNKNRIEMDSSEFEQYYDLITKDKITAMRIFTSDLIEEMVELREKTKTPIELRIVDNYIFFRYRCGQMFEPPLIRNGLDKKLLKNYYKYIYYPIEFLEKLCNNINEVAESE